MKSKFIYTGRDTTVSFMETVNGKRVLSELPLVRGKVVEVDASRQYFRTLIRRGLLIPCGSDSQSESAPCLMPCGGGSEASLGTSVPKTTTLEAARPSKRKGVKK